MKYCILSPFLSQEGVRNVSRLGYRVILTQPCGCFSPEVAHHPDLQFFKGEGERLYSVGATALPKELDPPVLVAIPDSCKGYGAEAKLNVLRLGTHLLGNRRLCSELIIPKTLKFIHVNQGYARCSSIPVGDHALITDDAGIARAARREGIDCLECEKGDVRLEGYPYGFLGGASLVLEDGIVGFFGELHHHKNGEEIKAFFLAHGVKTLSLCQGPLRDLGGGIVIEK